MIFKLKTWFRIQKRMAGFYIEVYGGYLAWPLALLSNWIFLVTLPIWIGLVYVAQLLIVAWKSKKTRERRLLTGEIWFYEFFRGY